jgi:esterase/lipase
MGNITSMAMVGTGVFDWKQMLFNLGGAVIVTGLVYAVTGVFLGPVGIVISGLGLGGLSAEMTRRKVVNTMKDELVKLLPKIASEQSPHVYKLVKNGFENYQQQVIQKINEDIQSQRKEINELIKQKETYEINREIEIQRLQNLRNNVHNKVLIFQKSYDKMLG